MVEPLTRFGENTHTPPAGGERAKRDWRERGEIVDFNESKVFFCSCSSNSRQRRNERTK